MNVQGFQKLTLLDFPGKVACTVFCGGCNLRCPFCHNGSLVQDPNENPNALEDVISYLGKRKGVLDGVCVTGGEPLLQKDLVSFLERVRQMGFLVKLDTNGSLPDRLEEVLRSGAVNYVAMDLKSGREHYDLATGTKLGFSPFGESMNLIRRSGLDYEFRTTAVKGIHREEDFFEIRDLLREDEKYFIQGFVDSGNILGEGVSAFSPEEMNRFLSIVRKKIPKAQLRGQEE